MKGLQAAQREGKLVQAIIGQREGHEVAEEVEIGDPTKSPGLTQHGCITSKEALLFVVCTCVRVYVCVCVCVCVSHMHVYICNHFLHIKAYSYSFMLMDIVHTQICFVCMHLLVFVLTVDHGTHSIDPGDCLQTSWSHGLSCGDTKHAI